MRATQAITTDQALDPGTVPTMPSAQYRPSRMPPATLRIRVKTSPWLRRLLPTRLVVNRAVRHAQALWEQSPEEREGAMATMETIIAGTPRAHEINKLAREYLIERDAAEALFWQPWAIPAVDPQSAARLQQALSADRGLLISACHSGPCPGIMSVFKPLGHLPTSIAGPWLFEKPSPDLWGRRVARWQKGNYARLIRSKGSFPILKAMLEHGEIVYISFDMPGRRETRFLGRPAMLADGSARLAVLSDALVLPWRTRRMGHRRWVDVGDALDPRQFAGAEELHNALAEHHERWILERPAEMEDPRSHSWGEGATAEAWIAPEPRESPLQTES
jgi:lauroyl/myristoyl acyltransferase